VREQRNHELQLKMLEALDGRGNHAGPSLTELIAVLKLSATWPETAAV